MFDVPLKILAIELKARACSHFIFKLLILEYLLCIGRLLSDFITILALSFFRIKVIGKLWRMLTKSLNCHIVINKVISIVCVSKVLRVCPRALWLVVSKLESVVSIFSLTFFTVLECLVHRDNLSRYIRRVQLHIVAN